MMLFCLLGCDLDVVLDGNEPSPFDLRRSLFDVDDGGLRGVLDEVLSPPPVVCEECLVVDEER